MTAAIQNGQGAGPGGEEQIEKGWSSMRKSTKSIMTILAAAAMGAVLPMTLMAGEAVSEAEAVIIYGETEEITEAVEEGADTAYIFDSPLGVWDCAAYEGNYNFQVPDDLYMFPDHILEFAGIRLPFEILDETHFSAEYDDGIRIEAEYGYLTEETIAAYEVDDYSFYYGQPGDPMLLVNVYYPDNSNPLAPVENVTTSVMVKTKFQYEYYEKFLSGKRWSVGDNTLAIYADGTISVNDDMSTGKIYFTSDDQDRAQIRFSWDNGGYFSYIPTGIDEGYLELTNVDNENEVLLLGYVEDLPAEAMEAVEEETEAYEDAVAEEAMTE